MATPDPPKRPRARFGSYLADAVEAALCEKTGVAFGWKKRADPDPLVPNIYRVLIGGCEHCGWGWERMISMNMQAQMPEPAIKQVAWDHMLKLGKQYECPHLEVYTALVTSTQAAVRDHLDTEAAKKKRRHSWDPPENTIE